MKNRRHTPEQIVRKLREADRLLGEGSAGDGRTPAAREAYLEAVITHAGALRWDWRETVPFFASEDALGFAAFGDVVLVEDTQELRAPIRATFFAVRANGGWRLRQFHGSIPQSPN